MAVEPLPLAMSRRSVLTLDDYQRLCADPCTNPSVSIDRLMLSASGAYMMISSRRFDRIDSPGEYLCSRGEIRRAR